MALASPALVRTRRHIRRLFDAALFVWGVAAAVNLVASGANDARQTNGWPGWLELVYLSSVLLAVPALGAAVWAKARLRRLGAVVEDERTAHTHLRSMATALLGALAVQAPFFFHAQTPSVAQAKFTVAATLMTYGAARLWFNRET